jgi:hypothetical protein
MRVSQIATRRWQNSCRARHGEPHCTVTAASTRTIEINAEVAPVSRVFGFFSPDVLVSAAK